MGNDNTNGKSRLADLRMAAIRFRATSDIIEIAKTHPTPPEGPITVKDVDGQDRMVRVPSAECPECHGRCYQHEKSCAKCTAEHRTSRVARTEQQRRELFEASQRRSAKFRDGHAELLEGLDRLDAELSRRGQR